MFLILWIYRVLFIPLLLVIGPIYMWKSRGRRGAKMAYRQRMGRMPELPPKSPGIKRVWIQAVSVGEFLAVQPIIDALLEDKGVEVVLTTTTITSQKIAQEKYGDRVLMLGYFSADFWPWVSRAWRGLDPDLMLLTEGEWWPEHLAQAKRRGVPVICMNARMSDRSYRRMRVIRAVLPRVLSGLTRLLASSAADADRFTSLGFRPDQVTVTGNIKVDIVINKISTDEEMALRRSLGYEDGDMILLGASTWPGEEETLNKIWQEARRDCERPLRLLLVPRHAERREEVESVVAASGATYTVRSRGPVEGVCDVCVADTTGELQSLTQIADVVFVGKSLRPHREGQTPVEAAGLGRALVFGPGMANFRAIAHGLVAHGAARQVADESELLKVVKALIADPDERERIGKCGQDWHLTNRGALELTLKEIERALERA
jgi:3-deoxy-D-manno-octulosonic-acid transferase